MSQIQPGRRSFDIHNTAALSNFLQTIPKGETYSIIIDDIEVFATSDDTSESLREKCRKGAKQDS